MPKGSGRKPKSVAEKRVTGNPGKRALTTIVPAPLGGAIPCPPVVATNVAARAYWDLYIDNAAPGHLLPIDAPLLARLCMCLARIDEAETKMGGATVILSPMTRQPIQSPYLAIINRQVILAAKLASDLALPPAARNRSGGHGANDPSDPAEAFLNGS